MCFSAGASFSAGVILSAIGVASIKKVKEPSQYAFAGIPLIFAVQQFTEGFLWLALTNPLYASLKEVTSYVFLFFAQIVWPVWVPFSILILTKQTERKFFSKALVLIGALVSIYLGYCLTVYPIDTNADNYHIAYEQDYPQALGAYGGALYIMATILPSFFSRIKYMWSLGTAILLSYIITTIFYEDYIVSVWCFFASIISITVYAILYQLAVKPFPGINSLETSRQV